MKDIDFTVDEDITKAQTITKEVYANKELLEIIKKEVFEKHWQMISDVDAVKIPGQYYTTNYLDSFIEEPLLLTRDYKDQIHCLSNVCTHRGTKLAEYNGHTTKHLRCRYHGRRFELNGTFHSMPEMEKAQNFPSEKDNLSKIPFEKWKKFIFTSLNPSIDFKNSFRFSILMPHH